LSKKPLLVIEEPLVDEIVRLDLLGARIARRDIIQNRLKGFRPYGKPWLQGPEFSVASGFPRFTVVNPQLFTSGEEPMYTSGNSRSYLRKSPASPAIQGIDWDMTRAEWTPNSLSALNAGWAIRNSSQARTTADRFI
jgi:hypothetical protein